MYKYQHVKIAFAYHLFTALPTFISYEGYSPEYIPAYHCAMYPLPPVYYHQSFDMTVNVSEDDVILTWYTQEDGILKCHHYPCEVYLWTADNRVRNNVHDY